MTKITRLFLLIISVLAIVIMAITIRGRVGNPASAELLSSPWFETGPFELSPERGRFALTYSLVEDNSVFFSVDLARFTTPDLGYKNGRYVSLFAPGVSYLVSLGYFLGRAINLSQLGTFAIIAIFALYNAFLIYKITLLLGVRRSASVISALTFLFASPAFAYGTTLYQHHISTALITSAIYLLLVNKSSMLNLTLIFALCAASIPIDYPNAFLMLPIGLYALTQTYSIYKTHNHYQLKIDLKRLLTLLSVCVPLILFGYFNKLSYGNPFQLSGTVAAIARIDANGMPAPPEMDYKIIEEYVNPDLQKKSALRFFEARDLINGLYTHLFARDRGMLHFTPILLFAVSGFFVLYRRQRDAAILTGSVALSALLLYSMWGDPWGGWAFGSRYLIPAYAMLAIALAFLYDYLRSHFLVILFLSLLTGYSLFVNTYGALGTIATPPKIQVLALEQQTGRQERYSWDRSYYYLHSGQSKSAFYNTILKPHTSPLLFAHTIATFLSLITFTISMRMWWYSSRKLL